MNLITATLALSLCFESVAFAQTKRANLREYFAALAENGQFNGGVLVAENGRIVYQKAFGYADFERSIPHTPTTSFAFASISKTITATAVLQLAQAGKLGLGEPVKKHLPWFPYDNITVRHLLSHTSGLPPYNAYFDGLRHQQPGRIFTNADFKEGVLANPRPLLYPPGDKGNYDNVNYLVLALLLEQVSGSEYGDYVHRWVLRPAGMKHTVLVPLRTQYQNDGKATFARAYLFPHRYSDSLVRAATVPYVARYWSAYNFSGFGDYVGTAHDLLAYDRAYYRGKVLSAASQRDAFAPVKLNNGRVNARNFGLGWEIAADTSLGKVVYHTGNATGSNGTLLRNVSRHQTVIVFDNIHADNAEAVAFAALKLLNGAPVPVLRQNLTALYARVLRQQGAEAARTTVMRLKPDTLRYELTENDLNLLGYDFMGGPNHPNPYHFPEANNYPAALHTFALVAELFPASWNAFDSYGEILLALGRKAEAIAAYTKSLALNPQNEGGRKVLARLVK